MFAPGVAPAFSRYPLCTKAIKQLFHTYAGAAFGGMDVYLEKTLLWFSLKIIISPERAAPCAHLLGHFN
jgi:hypothetical protein